MQFENIHIKFSILNVQLERLIEEKENLWISWYVIYDHTKDEEIGGLMLDKNFTKFDANQGVLLKSINTFFKELPTNISPKTNILYHEICVSSTILTNEILERFCTSQSYLEFINELGFHRSIGIDKCLVQLPDLKNLKTLNAAYFDNSRDRKLDLAHATNIKKFGDYYDDYLTRLQLY